MGKLKLLAVLSAIALVPSCSKNETPGYLSDPDAVRFEAVVGALTKSNPVGTPEEQEVFNEGDRIGISNGGDYVNYVLKDGSWVPEDASRYLKWDGENMTFRAYYPANNASSFEIGDVYDAQSEESVLKESDYMTVTMRSDKVNSLRIRMNRRTARVVVKIDSFRDEFDGTNPVVSVVKVHSPLKVPYTEPYSPSPIESFSRDGVFYALVCPGEAKPDQTFLELTVEYGEPKQTKTLTVKGVPAMEAGKSYTYSVIVGKNTVKVGSVSVKDWTTGEAIGDGLTEGILAWSGDTEPFALTDSEGNTLGYSDSPILIETPEQLAYLAEQVNAGNSYYWTYFKLTAEINLLRKPWTPIGNEEHHFEGFFYGDEKRIIGLNVNAEAGYGGLFGSVYNGMIQDVTIESASVTVGEGSSNAAVLCGYAHGSIIENCTVSGSVNGSGNCLGGIVGDLSSSVIRSSKAEVTVKGKSSVGGVCGYVEAGSELSGCNAIDSFVEGNDRVGGVVGYFCSYGGNHLNGSGIYGGSVKGTVSVGGIAGLIEDSGSSNSEVSSCCAEVDITVSGARCGGFAGDLVDTNCRFVNCHFDGVITKAGSDAGMVGVAVGGGSSYATFSSCWYNADKIGDLPVGGDGNYEQDYSGIEAINLEK